MYVHAGDVVSVVVQASGSMLLALGSDLQSRLQTANLRVIGFNHNAVPVSSGWSFGPMLVQVIPAIDYADANDVGAIVESYAADAGYYIQWGHTVSNVVANASNSQQYQQQQQAPPVQSPSPIQIPGFWESLGLDQNHDGQLDLPTVSPLVVAGGIVLVAVVLFSVLRR
jgi:hypothetical protein